MENFNDWLKSLCEREDAMRSSISKFVDNVYFKGLMSKINTSRSRGMEGVFGNTTLMSYVLAGRIMFTFTQGDKSFSIVGIEDEMRNTFGLTSAFKCELEEAIDMVKDVISNWDLDGFNDTDGVKLYTPVGDF